MSKTNFAAGILVGVILSAAIYLLIDVLGRLDGGSTTPPTDPLGVHSLNTDQEQQQGVDMVSTFSNDLPDNFELFASSYTIDAMVLKKVLDSNKVKSLAILNGLTDAGSFDIANRVFIIAPLDNTGSIPATGLCYVSSNLSMNTEPTAFTLDEIAPESPDRELLEYSAIRTYADNLVTRSTEARAAGVVLDTLRAFKLIDFCINKICEFNSAGEPAFNLRIRNAAGRTSGSRSLFLNQVNRNDNKDRFRSVMIMIDSSALCPNNCDFM